MCLSIVAVMFNLPDAATVKKVIHSLPRVGVGTNFGLPQTRWATQLNAEMNNNFICCDHNVRGWFRTFSAGLYAALTVLILV